MTTPQQVQVKNALRIIEDGRTAFRELAEVKDPAELAEKLAGLTPLQLREIVLERILAARGQERLGTD